MEYSLLIVATRYNVLIEYDGPGGIWTNHANFNEYNSEFNHGYSGGGPATLTRAIFDMLCLCKMDASILPSNSLKKQVFERISQIVTTEWKNNDSEPLVGSIVIPVDPAWVDVLPFLQKKSVYATRPGVS